jgi:hypothetical protein
MTAQYPGPQYSQGYPAPYPGGAPASDFPPSSRGGVGRVGALISLILSACVVLGLLVVRIFSAILSVGGEKLVAAATQDRIADVFGWMGIITIVPIAAAVVFGHLAWSSPAPRGRGLAGAALGVAYLLVILYFCRLVIAIITILPGFEYHSGTVASNFFWWS